MNIKLLKPVRVTIGISFFLLSSFVFIDFASLLSNEIIGYITGIQFLPSLLMFFSTLSLASIGFIIVLFITLLIGRFYCSAICPLGVYQDIILWLKNHIFQRSFFIFSKPHNLIRYSLAILTFVPLFFGNIIGVLILDPFSIYGRISSNILRFFYFQTNNGLDFISQKIGFYTFYHQDFKTFSFLAIFLSIVFIAFISILAFYRGRLYCNMICPVGTLLGLFANVSVFKFIINKDICNGCGACKRVCKSECIDCTFRTIDMSRCVTCFNCLSSCPSSGVKFVPFFYKSVSSPNNRKTEKLEYFNPERRNLVHTLLGSLVGLTGVKACTEIQDNKKRRTGFKAISQQPPVSPPGSIGITRFTELCTSCHLCITQCPSQVLKPSVAEYGWVGIMQPKMDYHTSFCNYDCVICSHVCPTGAILPISTEQKARIQLGKVRFIRRNCIVRAEGTECGACSEHCPTKAVYLVPFRGHLYIPEVNPDICVGCGACEYACPTVPFKAIYVETNIVHQVAKLPEKSIKNGGIDLKEEFPF